MYTLARAARMPVMAKTVCFITNLRHQHQCRRILAQIDLVTSVGKHQLFQPNATAFALFNTHNQRQIQPQLLKHIARHRHRALSAIHQHQIRHATSAWGRFPGPLGLRQHPANLP